MASPSLDHLYKIPQIDENNPQIEGLSILDDDSNLRIDPNNLVETSISLTG